MKSRNILLAAALLVTALVGGTASAASATTPVIPNAPVVSQTYGSCVNGKWTVQPALVTLPAVQNGRWYDPTTPDPTDITPTVTFTAAPGEYTYGMITAEGDYGIPDSPGGADDYRLENGVAYYTISIESPDPQDCRIGVTPYAPKVMLPASYKCINGALSESWGYIYAPSKVGQKWKQNGASVATSFYFSPATSATYTYTAVANTGYRIDGQSTWTFTITPAVKPVC